MSTRISCRHLSIALTLALVGFLEPAPAQVPDFRYHLEGPDLLRAAGPDAAVGATFDCVMTPVGTSPPQGPAGAQGWCIAVSAQGLSITGITAEGTVGAPAQDGPPGLQRGGYSRAELTTGEGNAGAVSCVVLSAIEDITLPPDRPSVVARIQVEGSVPKDGSPDADAVLRFVDGLRGSAQPVSNAVIWRGQSFRPATIERSVRVTARPAEFRRGDANLDGHLDISDSVFILSYLFLGGPTPACLDAADVDDSGELDISDGHGVNVFLFLGGSTPPAPGPFACGGDASPDTLGCLEGGCS